MKKRQFIRLGVVAALAFALVALMGCQSVHFPVVICNANIGAKVGQASGRIILFVFGNVEDSVLVAAKNGGITRIATVHTQVKWLLPPLVKTYTTTVTGE
jgi:hypothetical protein